MRPADRYFAFLAGALLAMSATWLDGYWQSQTASGRLLEETALVASLGLTDLALFTEARYTRHPTLADRHASFQDGPSSLDHFPSVLFLSPHFSPPPP